VALLTLVGSRAAGSEKLFSDGARDVIVALHREFHIRRLVLLESRRHQLDLLAAGGSVDFLNETAQIRHDPSWQVAPTPPELRTRCVEFIGPADHASTTTALNSGADVWIADLEDTTSPTWFNVVAGHLNLRDAVTKSDPAGRPAIMVKPRGLHLPEKHVLVDGEPVSGALLDVGLYTFHAGRQAVQRGTGPYFCLPKLANHLEARLWNDVFIRASELVGIPRGSIRATALIETVPAVFEMDEILFELREHSAGLGVGHSDLLFSILKSFRTRGWDGGQGTRGGGASVAAFVPAYTELLVATCHKRGTQAIGGLAPLPAGGSAVDQSELDAIRHEIQREAEDGFDGSQVAHPDLIALCREVFQSPSRITTGGNRAADEITAADLLDLPGSPTEVTEDALRENIRFGIRYLHSWLQGRGTVEDGAFLGRTATAEISRSLVWQWLQEGVLLADGAQVSADLVGQLIHDERDRLSEQDCDSPSDRAALQRATQIFGQLVLSEEYAEYMTLLAYSHLP
jgi:malate synthase